ncbi:MAG TPA: VCBS repeat-containing protein, partial [Planctomycetota bacterium]|nr:VCBS repeat-containing protein [Planctomycetota bacterium]
MRTFAGPLALAVLVVSCTRDENDEPPSSLLVETTEEALPPQSAERFPDGRYQIAEITCGGLALLDVEGDGDLDIYLVRHPTPDAPRSAAPNRVFLNRGDGTFTDPAAPTGLEDAGYGSSVAVGDFDQDGLVDVFVGNFGPDSLFRNRGDGTFENRTESAGIAGDGWSTAAAFFDYDADGDLDLWVARYLVDDPTRICRPSATERQDYCGPHRFQSLSDRLFRNRGDGTFEDASKEAGIVAPRASLGVVCLDLTGDGRLDVYVANDQQPNQLWVNIGDGRFRDEARERGVAVSGLGDSEASMGVAACDVDEDGFLDFFITNMADEKYTLYRASSNGQWDDRSASS